MLGPMYIRIALIRLFQERVFYPTLSPSTLLLGDIKSIIKVSFYSYFQLADKSSLSRYYLPGYIPGADTSSLISEEYASDIDLMTSLSYTMDNVVQEIKSFRDKGISILIIY